MGVRSIWRCDGCDKESDATDRKPSDWSMVTVDHTGLSKYPVCWPDAHREYVLCPDCQRTLSEGIDPTRWPRLAVAEPAE